MPDYVCPNCRGGFPDPISDGLENVRRCPWCGQALDGTYEYEPRVATVTRSEDDIEGGRLAEIFGWSE